MSFYNTYLYFLINKDSSWFYYLRAGNIIFELILSKLTDFMVFIMKTTIK